MEVCGFAGYSVDAVDRQNHEAMIARATHLSCKEWEPAATFCFNIPTRDSPLSCSEEHGLGGGGSLRETSGVGGLSCIGQFANTTRGLQLI